MANKQMSKQPTRIAHVIGKMWAGGVEAVVFNYYRAIDHNKFQFDFYYDADSTVEPPQDIVDMGAGFIEFPPYQQLPKYIKELRKSLRSKHYSIVHAHLNTLSVFPLYAAWREHVPVRIAHNHSVPGGNEIKRNAAKHVLRCFSKLFSTDYFACSEKAGRWMFGNRTFNDGKVFVVKNAVDFEKFMISDDDIEKKKKLLGIEGKFVVGHIGRFTYAKNHQFLLDVFKEIHRMKPEAVLLLVGDGELHDEIVQKIKTRGIEDCVVLTGKVQDPEKYYRINNVIVLPSIFEGLSMSTVESQAAGVPVVISRAIPDEAVISDGYRYMDITVSPTKWAEAAISVADKEIHLIDGAKEYDINEQAPHLEALYIKALKNAWGRLSEVRPAKGVVSSGCKSHLIRR